MLDQLNRASEKILSDEVSYDCLGKPSRNQGVADQTVTAFFGSARAKPQVAIGMALKEAKFQFLKLDPLMNQYFRVLYQVLKLIATNSPGSPITNGITNEKLEISVATNTEKFYSNLVRAFIPETIYYLLAINCFSENETDSYYSYKLLVERYALFEHMPLNLSGNQHTALMDQILQHYKAGAFGNNLDYKSRYFALDPTLR